MQGLIPPPLTSSSNPQASDSPPKGEEFEPWKVGVGNLHLNSFKLIDALGYGQSLLKGSKIEQPGHY